MMTSHSKKAVPKAAFDSKSIVNLEKGVIMLMDEMADSKSDELVLYLRIQPKNDFHLLFSAYGNAKMMGQLLCYHTSDKYLSEFCETIYQERKKIKSEKLSIWERLRGKRKL